jgi:hypothetical protein
MIADDYCGKCGYKKVDNGYGHCYVCKHCNNFSVGCYRLGCCDETQYDEETETGRRMIHEMELIAYNTYRYPPDNHAQYTLTHFYNNEPTDLSNIARFICRCTHCGIIERDYHCGLCANDTCSSDCYDYDPVIIDLDEDNSKFFTCDEDYQEFLQRVIGYNYVLK